MVARCFPHFCLQGVFVLDARGRDRASPYQWDGPFLMWAVARLVGEKSFERCPDYVSTGDIGDVSMLGEEEETEVSCVFWGLSEHLRAPSISLLEQRSGSWSDLSLQTVSWSWRLLQQERGPHGTEWVSSSGEVVDRLQVVEVVMMTRRLLRLYSLKDQAY